MRSWTVAVAACLVAVAPVWAQIDTTLRPGVTFGMLDPMGATEHAPVLAAGTTLSYADLSAVPTIGLRLDLNAQSAWVVRLSVYRSLDASLTGTWGCPPDASGAPVPCPDILLLAPTELHMTVGAAEILTPDWVESDRFAVRPLVGLVVARSVLTWDRGHDTVLSLAPGRTEATTMGLHLGLTTSVGIGPLHLEVTAGDILARVIDRRAGPTHSLLLQVGVGLSGR